MRLKTKYLALLIVTNLATITALTAVESKISKNTKINEIVKKFTDHDHNKCITTPEFDKLATENFATKLAQANLASKNDEGNFIKKADFNYKLKILNKKITSNKTKHVLIKNE